MRNSWGRAIGDWNRRRPWLKLVILGVIIVALVVTLILIYQKRGETGQSTAVATLEQPEELGGAENATEAEGSEVAEGVAEAAEAAKEVDYTGKKLIALTFDDGPEATTTPRLLDILKEKEVVATFFMLGGRVDALPEVAQRAEKEGHEVESHSLRHANLSYYGAEALAGDMQATEEIFTRVLGHGPKLLRPPYGVVNQLMREQIKIPLMLWSVDPRDWGTRDAGVVRENVRRDAFDGAVVLMHDIYDSTVDAVAGVIDDLREQGYELVTVQKLAELRRKEPLELGVAYGRFLVE